MFDLRKLRIAAGLSQVQVANRMRTTQTAVSRLERQEDWLVSTLVSYLEALGADARLFVTVGDEEIEVKLVKPRGKGR
jgi:transcriptional regulator with XRE-family HTH domain